MMSTLKKCKIIFALMYFDMGTCFYKFEQKSENFKILYIQNNVDKSEATISMFR